MFVVSIFTFYCISHWDSCCRRPEYSVVHNILVHGIKSVLNAVFLGEAKHPIFALYCCHYVLNASTVLRSFQNPHSKSVGAIRASALVASQSYFIYSNIFVRFLFSDFVRYIPRYFKNDKRWHSCALWIMFACTVTKWLGVHMHHVYNTFYEFIGFLLSNTVLFHIFIHLLWRAFYTHIFLKFSFFYTLTAIQCVCCSTYFTLWNDEIFSNCCCCCCCFYFVLICTHFLQQHKKNL